LNNNPSDEINDAENSQPDETNGEKDEQKDWNENESNENNENQSNDFHDQIQNTSIERVKVVAKCNRWSFKKGVEYEISKKIFDSYNGLFETL
jgi:hypothetical protein